MITEINISNFKIHRDTYLAVKPLTIVTGINGMGKSSLTQALLMLRDSVTHDAYPQRLRLKGPSFDIDELSGSLVNWYADKDPDKLKISLGFDDSKDLCDFSFIYPLENVTELERDPHSRAYTKDDLSRQALFNDNFQYLSAFRNGPEKHCSGDTYSFSHRQVSIIKGRGEYAIPILERYGDTDIPVSAAALPAPGNGDAPADLTLRTQTARWLGEISPRVTPAIDVDGNNYTLRYRYPGPGGRPQSVSPLNTGYGVSYILSVIVALLITPPGGLVIIENPEAHIHPGAQSALMRLVSLAVKGGVQVIIETHSDHIIFGALVNLKRKVLSHKDLGIYHFDIDDDNGRFEAVPITIGPDSRIKNPPRHFVEQMNIDLDILFDED